MITPYITATTLVILCFIALRIKIRCFSGSTAIKLGMNEYLTKLELRRRTYPYKLTVSITGITVVYMLWT